MRCRSGAKPESILSLGVELVLELLPLDERGLNCRVLTALSICDTYTHKTKKRKNTPVTHVKTASKVC